MNYQWHYDRLISTRKCRELIKGDYYEKHHVTMKSMGGTDDESNLIYLTAREHFIAHWLLWRIHKNRVTVFAFKMMQSAGKYSKRKTFSSIAYAESKEYVSIFGHSNKTREKISAKNKNRGGEKRTELTKKSMSISASKRKISEEGREKLRTRKNSMQDKTHSVDSKNKISETKLARYGLSMSDGAIRLRESRQKSY